MERLYQDYEADGFFPIMVMYDGTSAAAMDLANELGLTFPVLSDPGLEVFDRFNPTGRPQLGLHPAGCRGPLHRGRWYPALVEDLLYGE